MNYQNERWKDTLETMGLVSFDDWWRRDAKSAEVPNTKAGNPDAWSNVCTLKTPDGKTIYLKRQQDFYPNNWLQRQRRELTFEREYKNYLSVKNTGIPVYDLVYFKSRRKRGHRQAVYVAEGLDGFTSLEDLLPVWNTRGWPPREDRRRLLTALLEAVSTLHRKGILHNALSPRHLFFNLSVDRPHELPETVEFRLIDFERLKKIKPNSSKGVTRDLFTLHRRGANWPHRDRVWFLRQYLDIDKLDTRAKRIIRKFIREAARRDQN